MLGALLISWATLASAAALSRSEAKRAENSAIGQVVGELRKAAGNCSILSKPGGKVDAPSTDHEVTNGMRAAVATSKLR